MHTCAALLALVLSTLPASALAEREHTVRAGQSLSRIARRYGIAVASLAAANRLRPDASLREGQVLRVPEEGVIVVAQGQTLSTIARRHGLTVEVLARENGLRADAALQVGQELLLPGHDPGGDDEAIEDDAPRGRARDQGWGRPRTPGVVSLVRNGRSRERVRMRLVDTRGRARPAAIQRLSRLMRPEGMRRPPTLHPRLLSLITRVSDHFGGRPIHVVSGFRTVGGYTRDSSRHTRGRAMDLRVDGVPNHVVRDFCRRFENVGVGYYPRSTFVHLDVRDRSAYWVDWSRPGQAPIYRRPGEGPPEETADETGEGGLGDADEALAGAVAQPLQPQSIERVESEPKPPIE